jgi:hypothetical protein
MRTTLLLTIAGFAGGLVLVVAPGNATATPGLSVAAFKSAPAIVETVGWRRRYWRRYGVLPDAPPPDVPVDTAVVPGDVPVVVPVRPLSCGEYHYWNGEACVDARYNDPYLGPKP